MTLVWEDLSFTAPNSFATKIKTCFQRSSSASSSDQVQGRNIISHLNGRIELGKMVALLGPSGSGKTTVLKCLVQGKSLRGFCPDGRILVDGKDRALTSYICQRDLDHLLVSLTVEESLMYASQMKNPWTANHESIINEQIDQLRLGRVRKNMVKKLSGGECKRLVVGLELTSDPKPNYLFLDEPTSGLDSLAVLELLDTLSALVYNKPMAVVTVIHQPSYEALLKFDQVYFLSKAGHFIYGGSPGTQILEYIEYHGYYGPTTPQIQNNNPADIMIKIASASSRVAVSAAVASVAADLESVPVANEDVEAQAQCNGTGVGNGIINNERTPLEKICESMASTYQASYLLNRVQLNNTSQSQLIQVQDDGLCKNSSTCCIKNLWILLKRSCRSTILGQPTFLLIRLSLHVIIAIMLAALHNRQLGVADSCYTLDPRFNMIQNGSCTMSDRELLGVEEPVSEQNVKFQFFSLLFLMFASLLPTVLSYSAEIKVFLNEHRNGWYTTSTYYISKTLTEIPFQILYPFFYIWFLYWYTGQIDMDGWYNGIFGLMSWRYTMFLSILIIACFIAQGLGFLIGILCINSSNSSILLSCSSLIFLFLFSGFFVKTADMSPQVVWITYTSFVRFALESLLIVIYGYDRCGLIPVPGTEEEMVPTKPAVLFAFNLHDDDLRDNINWLLAHLILIRFAAFIALKFLADPKFLSLSCISRARKSKCVVVGRPSCFASLSKILSRFFQTKGFQKGIRNVGKIFCVICLVMIVTAIIVCIMVIINALSRMSN